MIKKKIKIPLYNQFVITVIIGDNITQEIVNITKTPTDVEFKGVFCYRENGTDLIMGFEKNLINQGTIAHECLHATFYILDYVGMSLDAGSEEAYTYLLGYLVGEVNKLIK